VLLQLRQCGVNPLFELRFLNEAASQGHRCVAKVLTGRFGACQPSDQFFDLRQQSNL